MREKQVNVLIKGQQIIECLYALVILSQSSFFKRLKEINMGAMFSEMAFCV